MSEWERERLVELLLESEPIKERDLDDDWGDNEISDIAEHLIKNDVIVPHAKIGESIYYVELEISADKTGLEPKIHRTTVTEILITNTYTMYSTSCKKSFLGSMFGIEVFLTKEEAEKALKGGAE